MRARPEGSRKAVVVATAAADAPGKPATAHMAGLGGSSAPGPRTTALAARLDDLIHQPVRFSLLAALAQADELEFRFVRDTLDVSDSVLSRQASTLEQAGT